MRFMKPLLGQVIVGLLVLCITTFAIADIIEPWSGKVVSISDGDTISVMREGKAETIRLAEIDCPEKSQSFGNKAKRLTSDLCFGKTVLVKPATIGKYGRIVAHVILPDNHNLSEDLISAGLAWHYKQYSSSSRLAQLEIEARAIGLGIWSEPTSIPPWEWRHGNNQGKGLSINENSQRGYFHGNIKSKIFHCSTCRYYNCKNCIEIFKTREEAIQAGYRPCRICNP